MTRRAHSAGFAAISAILIVAAVTGIGIYLVWQGTLATRQAENIADARQARQFIHVAGSSAMRLIAQDDPRVDHRGEAWARGIPVAALDGATATAYLTDEQAKFNVNNLADRNGASEADLAAFKRLLAKAGLPEALADAVLDWVDADDAVTAPGGAEDAYYAAREQPYRTANREVAEIGELLLIKGFTGDHLRRLAPYITALPGRTKVNVNSASAEMLAALLPEVSLATARAIAVARDKEPFGSSIDFARRLPATAAHVAGELLDVRSDYFVVRGSVRAGRVNTGYHGLVTREGPTLLSITQDFG